MSFPWMVLHLCQGCTAATRCLLSGELLKLSQPTPSYQPLLACLLFGTHCFGYENWSLLVQRQNVDVSQSSFNSSPRWKVHRLGFRRVAGSQRVAAHGSPSICELCSTSCYDRSRKITEDIRTAWRDRTKGLRGILTKTKATHRRHISSTRRTTLMERTHQYLIMVTPECLWNTDCRKKTGHCHQTPPRYHHQFLNPIGRMMRKRRLRSPLCSPTADMS